MKSPRLDLRRPPTVRVRPLGREQAHGLAYTCPSDGDLHGSMEIDARLKGRALLETLIHELLHLIFPGMLEEDVRRAGRYLALCLWAWGIKIDEDHIYELVQHRKSG